MIIFASFPATGIMFFDILLPGPVRDKTRNRTLTCMAMVKGERLCTFAHGQMPFKPWSVLCRPNPGPPHYFEKIVKNSPGLLSTLERSPFIFSTNSLKSIRYGENVRKLPFLHICFKLVFKPPEMLGFVHLGPIITWLCRGFTQKCCSFTGWIYSKALPWN